MSLHFIGDGIPVGETKLANTAHCSNADGTFLDVNSALKIKHHLVSGSTLFLIRVLMHLISKAQILAFENIKLVPSNDTMAVRFDGLQATPSISQPCLSALLRAIDCGTTLGIRPSAMGIPSETDTPTPCIVGALFVDITLYVVTKVKLSDTTYLMARSWLEMLVIIVLKVLSSL